jgi:GNAT superfamily N-acetyltransferase
LKNRGSSSAGTFAKRYPACVALVEEKIVGWCDVLPIDRPTRAHTGVLGIGVLAEFRGRGIGTALIRKTLEKARASGAYPDRARRAAVQRNAVRLDGKYENLICMALLLD